MARKKDLIVRDWGEEGIINIQSSHHDHVYVHVKDGEFIHMGVDRGCEGGGVWYREWMDESREGYHETKEHLFEHLAYYVGDFGTAWYEKLLELAHKDREWLPPLEEVVRVEKEKRLKRLGNARLNLRKQIEDLHIELSDVEEKMMGLQREGIKPAKEGRYDL